MSASTQGGFFPTGQVSHESIVQTPVRDPSLTANQSIVSDVVDVFGVPPVDIGQDYLGKCVRVAVLFGVPSAPAEEIFRSFQVGSFSDMPTFVTQRSLPSNPSSVSPFGDVSGPVVPGSDSEASSHVAVMNAAFSARNNVFSFVSAASAAATQIALSGISSPEDPFVAISNIEARRRSAVSSVGNSGAGIIVDKQTADRIVSDISSYVNFFSSEMVGPPADLSSAQISSFAVSLDGFGSGGNSATDLMRFLPDGDEVRTQKESDLLSAFDFRLRTPQVIFTADYAPEGSSQGMVIGWKKIGDASGYVVTCRSVFENTERSIQLSNSDLQTSMDNLREYLKTYLLSFYDTVDDTQLCVYLDRNVSPDQYYLYQVQAFQTQNSSQNQIFSVETNPSALSSVNQGKLLASMGDFAHRQLGPSAQPQDVNPWPFVSIQLYGDSQFDWVLSAVNSRASVNRNDPSSDTRLFSYLGATVTDLLELMSRGKFVVPKDIGSITKNVNDAVVSFGISQTIGEILHETGILFYLEGSTIKRPGGFDRSSATSFVGSSLLDGVLSSIDSETTTIDLSSLGRNLSQIGYGNSSSKGAGNPTGLTMNQPGVSPNPLSTSQEIDFPDSVSQQTRPGLAQGVGSVAPTPGDSAVDLTKFAGISTLVRVIRLFIEQGTASLPTSDSGLTGSFSQTGASSSVYGLPPKPAPTMSVPSTDRTQGTSGGTPVVIRKPNTRTTSQ